MSVQNQCGEEQIRECPLCMEPWEVDDLHFYPCTCGYQICRFCWNRIRETENGLCPACRKAYPENPADFTPLSQEQVAAIKTEKKAREQKKRNKTLESRRALANVRVVQNNLVFVVGLPVRLADPEILKRQEYFGKYGKIHKVVINQSTTYAGSQCLVQGPSASAYVTYVSMADALRAIQGVNNVTLDGRVLKGSLGTTKYCANFMKNQPCPKPDCMYLHELGDPKASFTKEEMHQGLHQVYERKLHNQLLASQRDKPTDTIINTTGNSCTNGDKGSSKDDNLVSGNNSNFITTTVITSSHNNVVNSSKSNKKECVNGNGNGNGSSSSGSSTSGKEAWPSLSNSQPDNIHSVKSQENGTSESSSPTQQTQSQTAQTKNSKENYTETNNKNRNKDNSTNGQNKKNKSDSKKHKNTHSINSEETETVIENKPLNNTTHASSVFENDKVNSYLSNELDELESDRHSLLENYDLLDSSDHSLLEDDTHNLLDDANNEPILLQNNREMLSGLVDNNHLLPHMKSPLVNGFGLLDRDVLSYLGNDRPVSQINQGHMEQKELLLRERSRSEMLMRQNELLARQHNVMVEPKRFMPTSSIGLESASELLGANYHPNTNMLPPFGMRMENSIAANPMGANSLSASSLSANTLGGNTMSVNSLGGNTMSVNSLGGNTMSVNSLGGSSLSVNPLAGNTLGGNTVSVNSLGGNKMSVNALGGNTMTVNALGGNTMSVNALSGNTMSVNALGGNTMSVNALGGNTMSINALGGNNMSVNALVGNNMSVNALAGNNMALNALGGNNMTVNAMGGNLTGNALGGSSMGAFMLHNHNQQLLQNQQHMQQSGLVNGLDSQSNEGRYLAENMDKFFTDFHKAQQMKLVLIGQNEDRRYTQHTPHNMLTVNSLEMDHKQRLNNMRGPEVGGGRAAGDGDDDLDFDPFKETQKALAEMMETEMMQNSVSSGDNMERVRRSRLVPPGFQHVNAFSQPRPHHLQQGIHNHASSAMFSDWTAMDPAIVSTSVGGGGSADPSVLARLGQLQLQGAGWAPQPWACPIPLPPGFAPPKPSQHAAECIDAK